MSLFTRKDETNGSVTTEVFLSGSAPSFEKVKAGVLSIDPLVQRKLSPSRARRIAKEFNPLIVGTLLVSKRADGKQVVIDGQHRLSAINELGYSEMLVQCEVHEGLTIEDEAALFNGRNDAQKPGPFDRFDKGVLSKDETCLRIKDVLSAHGLRVVRGRTVNGVCAVNALVQIDGYGNDVLTRTLAVARSAWPMDLDSTEGNVLKAIALVINKYPETVNDSRLVEKLTKTIGKPSHLLGVAKSRSTIGSSKAQIMAEEIIAAYNQRLSSKTKLA